MFITSRLGLIVLGLRQALLQSVAVVLWQSSTASVSTENVNCGVIVAVDHLISVAVLLELDHVVLDGAGSAQRLVHTVLKGARVVRVIAVLHRLLGVRPVGTGDAEQSTDLTVAGQSAVAVAHRLADAAQTDVSDWSGVDGGRSWGGIVLHQILLLELLGGQLRLGQLELFRIELLEGLLLGQELLLLGEGGLRLLLGWVRN